MQTVSSRRDNRRREKDETMEFQKQNVKNYTTMETVENTYLESKDKSVNCTQEKGRSNVRN